MGGLPPEGEDPRAPGTGGCTANLDLLADDGRIKNAGAWLLTKDIRKFHASAQLSCVLFFGTTKTEILDRRDFAADVYSMIEGAMTWVRSKVNVHYVITGSVKREERPELPMDAVREAVVNAVAHRDYRSTANVQVCLYHDRLEVVSPGGLPAGMTEAALGVKRVCRAIRCSSGCCTEWMRWSTSDRVSGEFAISAGSGECPPR